MPVKWTSNMAKVMKSFDPAINRGLTAVGLFVEAIAVLNITDNDNVITGRLRGSITFVVNGETSAVREPAKSGDEVQGRGMKYSVIVGSNVDYAPWIEKSIRGKGKPFLRPAVDNHKASIIKIFNSEFLKGLK